MYDSDSGDRESLNAFYMIPNKVEAFSTKKQRDERVEVLNSIFKKLEDPTIVDVQSGYEIECFELEVDTRSLLEIPEVIRDDLEDLEYKMSVNKEGDQLVIEVKDVSEQSNELK